jgi:hypothetical protein
MNKYRCAGFKVLEISREGGLIRHPMIYPCRSSAKRWIAIESPSRPNSTFSVCKTRSSASGDLALLLRAVDKVMEQL